MITLSDFPSAPALPAFYDPRQVHTVPVGPHPIRNWQLALMTARDCLGKYGHAIILSNGSMEKPATLWRVEREVA